MTIQIDAKMACVRLTKSFGLDIVVAMKMLSYDAPMFPKTAENSEQNSGRAAVLLFAERRRPRIPAASAASIADNLPQQQQKQRGCLSHHKARCLSASFEMYLYTSGQTQSGFIE
jgi:hypothetical protein